MIVRSFSKFMWSVAKRFGLAKGQMKAPVFLLISLAALLPATPGFAQVVSFGPQASFNAGSNPISVSIGDLNGDGKPDLAVANSTDGNVSILLGTGTGAFGAATNFNVAVTPAFVVIGNLDGDANPDLAVGNSDGGNFSILFGDGTGDFSSPNHLPVAGLDPLSVAIGDFNGNGNPDLVTANRRSHDVSILLGDGSGAFGPATTFAVGTNPRSVAIGDLNNDGKPDLAVANINSDNVSILLGDGTGAFGPATNFAVGDQPISVAIGDLNGDGNPDLAVANTGSEFDDGVSILLGTGTGAFGAATNFDVGANPTSVAIGDLNGDGKPDLALANGTGGGTVSILLGTGTGAFGTATDFAVGSGPRSVAIGDLNGDGKLDLVTANTNSGITVSVLLNTTVPTTVTTTAASGLNFPFGVAVDNNNGDIYIADRNNHVVWKIIGPTERIAVAGTGEAGYNGDGILATTAQLSSPTGVAVDRFGNLFIADSDSHIVRKVVLSSGMISTVAGTPTKNGLAVNGGLATAATLFGPRGVAVDEDGNLYIADTMNQQIRKVVATGVDAGKILAVAGVAGQTGANDGPVSSARLNSPLGLAVDGNGNVYIADEGNNKIRMVSGGTTVTTVAGTGAAGFSGDSGPATAAMLDSPSGVTTLGDGTLFYIADVDNNRIRRVFGGVITTVTVGSALSSPVAVAMAIDNPSGVLLYIADLINQRILKVDFTP